MKAYAIKKDGLYLSSLFDTTKPSDMAFEARTLEDCYIYNGELIAHDVARHVQAQVIAVHKPNAPFGNWELSE